jgi:enolase
MVVRTRLGSILVPIVFYLVLGVASGYLVWGASNGLHGLKAKYNQLIRIEEELGDEARYAGRGALRQ